LGDLEASRWDIAEARANRLPKLTLTANFEYSAEELSDLFDNWANNLAAGLVGPIFDGNERKAEVARTKAVRDERFIQYTDAVYTAFLEVENALVNEHEQKNFVDATERQYLAASQASTEAYKRYTRGAGTYFDALTQETSRQNLEVNVLQSRYELLADRIYLYKVLGGNWAEILGGAE